MPRTKSPLAAILERLEGLYGRPAPPAVTDPFERVLWENVAYLASDEKRAAAFEALRERVGLTPERILAAPVRALREVASLGGIMADRRAGKLLRAAEIALKNFGGDLQAVLRRPLPEAKKALMKFPSIGEPGAETILLFSKSHPVLALDSNALRVLNRLGYGEPKKTYASTYRAAQEAATAEVQPDCEWLIRAHQLLRRHGQGVCRRSRPRCAECPVSDRCACYRKGMPAL